MREKSLFSAREHGTRADAITRTPKEHRTRGEILLQLNPIPHVYTSHKVHGSADKVCVNPERVHTIKLDGKCLQLSTRRTISANVRSQTDWHRAACTLGHETDEHESSVRLGCESWLSCRDCCGTALKLLNLLFSSDQTSRAGRLAELWGPDTGLQNLGDRRCLRHRLSG